MSTVSLIRADCRRVMPSFPDGFVDLVVTSPPYDAGKEYEGRRKGDPGAAAAFARSWAPLVPRLLTSRGSFWLNVGYLKTGRNTTLPLTYVYYDVLRGTGLQLVQEIVWHYEGGEAYKLRYTHRTERWQWWARDADRANGRYLRMARKRLEAAG